MTYIYIKKIYIYIKRRPRLPFHGVSVRWGHQRPPWERRKLSVAETGVGSQSEHRQLRQFEWLVSLGAQGWGVVPRPRPSPAQRRQL